MPYLSREKVEFLYMKIDVESFYVEHILMLYDLVVFG